MMTSLASVCVQCLSHLTWAEYVFLHLFFAAMRSLFRWSCGAWLVFQFWRRKFVIIQQRRIKNLWALRRISFGSNSNCILRWVAQNLQLQYAASASLSTGRVGTFARKKKHSLLAPNAMEPLCVLEPRREWNCTINKYKLGIIKYLSLVHAMYAHYVADFININ